MQSASRRRLGLLALQHFNLTAAVVLGGLILLLLLGTQILHWYWLVLLAVGGLVWGGLRLQNQFLTHYQVAQMLDRRLRLSDTLSTAWFLLATSPHSGAASQLQLRQAEKVARSVQTQLAFPFQPQRSWAITAMLLLVACTLFGFRYFSEDRLSLQHAFIPIHFGSFIEQLEGKLPARAARSQMSQTKNKQHSGDAADKTESPKGEDNFKSGAKNEGDPRGSEGRVNNSRDNQRLNDRMNSSSKTNSRGRDNQPSADANSKPESSDEQRRQQRNSTNNKVADGEDENGNKALGNTSQQQSLAGKIREALSGLMQKIQSASRSSSAPQEAKQSAAAKSGNHPNSSEQNPQSNPEEDATSEANNRDANSSQAQQARSDQKTGASQGEGSDSAGQQSADAHSAAGHQDGSKGTKEAEQQKAMGKLAEIIGKRSREVSGEMTVETLSGKQQLTTEYTQKNGPP